MKSLFFIICSLFFLHFGYNSIAQNDDAPYFIYEKGAKIKIGHFNKRQIPQGYTIYTVTNVLETDTANYVTIKAETLDKYERPLYSTEFEAEFYDGAISIDMIYLMPIDTLASISESDWDVTGRNFSIPAFLGNGLSLTSSYVILETENNKYFKVSEFSRIVDKFEQYETNFGKFETCVITSKLEYQFTETELYTITTWYSKGIGPLRSNYYNKKRKLVKYSEIVEIILPEKS